jgi:Family of unknown function (DUF6152)
MTTFEEAHEMIKRTLGCMALVGLMATGSLLAHHSLAGVYDMKGDKELSGAVKSVKFVNPHGSLTVTVKSPDGTATDWTMTMGSATSLAQRGVGLTGPNALKVGDEITVHCLPAINGSPLGFLKNVKFPDGHVVVISAGNNPNE